MFLRNAACQPKASGPPPNAVIGIEQIANGDFASGAGWTLTNAAIGGGNCTYNGSFGASAKRNAIQTLVPGVYRFICDDVAGIGTAMTVRLANNNQQLLGGDGVHINGTINLAAVVDNTISIIDSNGEGWVIDNASLKRES